MPASAFDWSRKWTPRLALDRGSVEPTTLLAFGWGSLEVTTRPASVGGGVGRPVPEPGLAAHGRQAPLGHREPWEMASASDLGAASHPTLYHRSYNLTTGAAFAFGGRALEGATPSRTALRATTRVLSLLEFIADESIYFSCCSRHFIMYYSTTIHVNFMWFHNTLLCACFSCEMYTLLHFFLRSIA